MEGVITDNKAYILTRIYVFERRWIQALECKFKYLDSIYDVEDGMEKGDQRKEKMAFHFLKVVTILEDLSPFRQ